MTQKEKVIQVALVDDHAVFRDGLANLLSEYDDLKVLFTARNGEDLQEKMEKGLQPDVVVMDINMPGMGGLEATHWVKQNYPLVQVLALSMYEDDLSIIKMIRQGAGGYILKESNTEEVVKGIRGVVEQGYFLNELISGKLILTIQRPQASSGPKITERELAFLKYCCSELTYKEIADRMGVSPRTIDNYREDLFLKLQIKSRVGLVLYALKNDIVKLSDTKF